MQIHLVILVNETNVIPGDHFEQIISTGHKLNKIFDISQVHLIPYYNGCIHQGWVNSNSRKKITSCHLAHVFFLLSYTSFNTFPLAES